MQLVLSILLLGLTQAEIRLSRFTAMPAATAVYQLDPHTVYVANSTGHFAKYTAKGQLLSEEQWIHKTPITSLEGLQFNSSQSVVVADKGGSLSVWGVDGTIEHSINKSTPILQVAANSNNNPSLLAMNMGSSIDIYELPSYNLTQTLQKEDWIFRKMWFGEEEGKLYLLMQRLEKRSICAFDFETDTFEVLLEREQLITDFAVSPWNGSRHLFIINQNKHLQIYHFNSANEVVDSLSKELNHLMSSSYSKLAHFRNSQHLPLFVAVKEQSQLEFYNGFDIQLFLQLSSEVKIIRSTYDSSLILLSENGQVTTVEMGSTEESTELWILGVSVVLLGVGLWVCCGDCGPGLLEKWKLAQEQQEIEMQLYRQRTDLQNF